MGTWQLQIRTQPLGWEYTFNKGLHGGDRYLEFRKIVAISSLFDQCVRNLVGMLRIWYGTHCIVLKRKFIRSQVSVCRHLELRRNSAIPSLFDLFSPNLVGMLQIRCWMQLLSRKWAQGLNSKMAAAAILIFKRCGLFITIKPFLTKHVGNIKYRPAGKKTANINVKYYISLKRGVYRPDSTYKTSKMIYQNTSQ